jgi:hypothetical protein
VSESLNRSRARKAELPGYSWRILAHKKKIGPRTGYDGEMLDIRSGPRWFAPTDADTGQKQLQEGAWEFDEVVIDDWFHLEQMGVRNWWLGVGNGDDYWHVNVHIDTTGQAHVSIEKQ